MISSADLHVYRDRKRLKAVTQQIFDMGGQKMSGSALPVKHLDETESTKIERLHQVWFDRLSLRKVARVCDLCSIEYDRTTNKLKLDKKTKLCQHMGYQEQGSSHTLLYPEEALFLADTATAEINCNGVPLSFNEALFEFSSFTSGFLCAYLVYSNLVRSGYIVRRFLGFEPGDSRKKTCAVATTKNNISFDFESEPSFLKVNPIDSLNLDTKLPVSHWCFDKIHVPNDYGDNKICLSDPDPSFLPFPLQYTDDRRFLFYADFSKRSRTKRFYSRNFADRRYDASNRRRYEFYKTNNSLNFDANKFSSWKDYKIEKLRLCTMKSVCRETEHSSAANSTEHDVGLVHERVTTEDEAFRLLSVVGVKGNNRPADNNSSSGTLLPYFNVFHSTERAFTLRRPPLPAFHLAITDVDNPVPSVSTLIKSFVQCPHDGSFAIAVVDNAEVMYFKLDRVPNIHR